MNVPLDPEFLELIAADLGVDASFIEKDWHAMGILKALCSVNELNMRLVFSGGTSLSKGFGLIERFSEDLDFKVILPEEGFNRDKCRDYRYRLVEAIRKGSADWLLEDKYIKSNNQGRFFSCQIAYSQNFTIPPTLRPNIRLEITFKPPVLPVEEKSLQSFISKAMKQPPEVPIIACVSPTETAADKLSALTWRVLSRQRGNKHDDPTLIRHLHDLSALENFITEFENFPNLVVGLLTKDAQRNKNLNFSAMSPIECLQKMLQCLSDDPIYLSEYQRFVTAMSYATEEKRPSFIQALEVTHRIVSQIQKSFT